MSDFIRPNSEQHRKWLCIVCRNGLELESAPEKLKDDKNIVTAACKQNGLAIVYASEKYRNDKDVVTVACDNTGWALEYASDALRDDKDVVKAACRQLGYALGDASARLRADKEVVLVAVKKDGDALKFALGGLNQDPDCLVASGLWDGDYASRPMVTESLAAQKSPANWTKIVLSTRFALTEKVNSKATEFAKLLKEHKYIWSGNFAVYSPNAFNKHTCDPKWTRFDWPCRGTKETCRYENVHNDEGHPTDDCCWRYSFRCQLQDAKRTNGFMIQLVEVAGLDGLTKGRPQKLGDGQKIERDMAKDLQTKVFRVHVPLYDKIQHLEKESDFSDEHIETVVSRIRIWYEGNCADMSECVLHFRN